MKNQILIAGAGPVGLAAALFLRRQGISVRIFDPLLKPVEQSKALAVNPRTLEILEPSGITDKMLQLGLRMRAAQFWQDGKVFAELDIKDLKHRYPFLLALSQSVTEKLLTEALAETGVQVERGFKLTQCRNIDGGVEIEIEDLNGKMEILQASKLIAADGAHSMVRHQLNVNFAGTTFEEEWYLLDVPMATSLEMNRAHIFLPHRGGFVFMIPVVTDATHASTTAPIWRVLSNFENPLLHLDQSMHPEGSPVWESRFKVSHRINEHLAVGNIFFCGDAAHIHSPVGARGMNLGIEDAFVFSELLKQGRLNDYDSHRRTVDRSVVKKVDLISRMALGNSKAIQMLRKPLLQLITGFKPARQNILKAMSGLDHTLP